MELLDGCLRANSKARQTTSCNPHFDSVVSGANDSGATRALVARGHHLRLDTSTNMHYNAVYSSTRVPRSKAACLQSGSETQYAPHLDVPGLLWWNMHGRDSCLLVPSLHCHVVQVLIMFIKKLVSVTRDLRPWPSHDQEPCPDSDHAQTGKPNRAHSRRNIGQSQLLLLHIRVMVQDCKHGTNGEYRSPRSVE